MSDETPQPVPPEAEAAPPPVGRATRGFRSRTVLLAAAAILAAAALLFLAWLLTRPGDGSVPLLSAPADATSTITFAGVFPPPGDPRLARPTGTAVETTRVYVAESGGLVRVFADNGRGLGGFRILAAAGATTVSLSALAVSGARLAVLDTASSRVVLLALPGGRVAGAIQRGRGEKRLAHPTAVAAVGSGFVVADGGVLKTFGPDGAWRRTEAIRVAPPVAFVGGIGDQAGSLWLSDSSGRLVILRAGTSRLVDRRFGLPKGVTNGPGTTMLVVDSFAQSLLQLDRTGRLVASAGTPEGAALPEQGLLSLPRDAAWMSATGRVYVTDTRAGVVRVYNVAERITAGR